MKIHEKMWKCGIFENSSILKDENVEYFPESMKVWMREQLAGMS